MFTPPPLKSPLSTPLRPKRPGTVCRLCGCFTQVSLTQVQVPTEVNKASARHTAAPLYFSRASNDMTSLTRHLPPKPRGEECSDTRGGTLPLRQAYLYKSCCCSVLVNHAPFGMYDHVSHQQLPSRPRKIDESPSNSKITEHGERNGTCKLVM